MSILLREVACGPAARLSAAMESWQPTPLGAPAADDLLEAVRRCLELPAQLNKVTHQEFAREDAFQDLPRLRSDLRTLYLCAKATVRGVQYWIEAMTELDIAVPGADQLAATLSKIEEMEDALFKHWMLPSEVDVQHAKEAQERGETLELADAFAQIKGMTRAEWLLHVEEYQRSDSR